jgi:hypothetical protein
MLTYLSYTQKESSSKQARVACCKTHERHDETPAKHENRHPAARPHHLQDDVGRDFKKRVRYEE